MTNFHNHFIQFSRKAARRMLLTTAFLALANACGSSTASKDSPTNPVLKKNQGDSLKPGTPSPTNKDTYSEDAQLRENSPRLIRSEYSAGEVTRLCDETISKTKGLLDLLAQQPAVTYTFDTTLGAIERTMASFSDSVSPLTFMGYVSTDEGVSNEGSTCEAKTSEFTLSVFSRKDLFNLIKDLEIDAQDEQKAVKEALLTYWKTNFTTNGLALDDAARTKVLELKTKLTNLESQFTANLNQSSSTVEFTREELEGVSADFLGRLKKTENDKYIVTTKSTDFQAVANNAKNSETRRRMQFAYDTVAADKNIALLEEAITVRLEIAKLFGKKNWAEYRIQNRMAPDAKTVLNFLNDLKQKLKTRTQADLNNLLNFKKSENSTATKLDAWDIRYYSNQAVKRDYNVDQEAIREYFPADKTVEGMFRVYSTLLGVNYKDITATAAVKPWHETVRLYEVQSKETGKPLAYFYADFVPRSLKYGHAAAFPLITGRTLDSKTYSLPVSSIVANFTPPTGDKPSLLSHGEVETLFHEFGHIMQQILTTVPYASISGTAVAQDYVEAPSQVLENWVWEKDVLKSISTHYKTGESLADETINKMIAAKNFNLGYLTSRQLVFGLQDMAYHTAEGPVNTTAIQQGIFQEVMNIVPMEGTAQQASFGHLMGGYDAGYYGYLWSQVYADDLFTQFKGENLLSPEVGGRYRKTILEQGAAQSPLKLLEEFLGRAPNSDAFFKNLEEGI